MVADLLSPNRCSGFGFQKCFSRNFQFHRRDPNSNLEWMTSKWTEKVREQEVKVKETEAITIKNSEEEDKLENKISRLREEFKLGILIQF